MRRYQNAVDFLVHGVLNPISRLLIQVLGHRQMMFQRGSGFRGPCAAFRVLAFIAVPFEKIDGVFMGIFLIRVVPLGEIVPVELLQIVQHALLRQNSSPLGIAALTLPPSIIAFSSADVFM